MAEKILIVDDDVDSLKLIGLMLQRHGYEVLAANNGSQALQKAQQEQPNLIILDVMMPDMNGLEVCRRMRTNTATEKIPIIMFTAKTMIDDKVKGFEAGADDYLTKPTHPAELASRVRAVLARSAAKNASMATTAEANGTTARGRAIGVIGAKGGVGTTTVAINLAAALMQAGNHPVLADFRPGQGSIGSFLGFPRSQGMAQLFKRPAGQINARAVENEMINHQSGLQAVVSSFNPRESQINIPGETSSAILKGLQSIGDLAVIDLGSGYNNMLAGLYQDIDTLVIVVEPNPVALAMARELASMLENSDNASQIHIVVVNRSQSTLQTPWHEVENALGREIKAIISAAPELAFQAMQQNTPMVLLQPGAIVSGQFVQMAESLK